MPKTYVFYVSMCFKKKYVLKNLNFYSAVFAAHSAAEFAAFSADFAAVDCSVNRNPKTVLAENGLPLYNFYQYF